MYFMKLSSKHNKFHFLVTRPQLNTLTDLSNKNRGYLTFDVIFSDVEKPENDILFFLREIKIAGPAEDIVDYWMKDRYWEADFGALIMSQSFEDDSKTLLIPFLKTEKKWDASDFGKRYLQVLKHIEDKADVDLYCNIYVITIGSHYLLWRDVEWKYGEMIYRYDIRPIVFEEVPDFENRLKQFNVGGKFPDNDLI